MKENSAHTPSADARSLLDLAARLRRRLFIWRLAVGLLAVGIALLAAGQMAAWLDYFFLLDRAERLALDVFALAAAFISAWKVIARPLRFFPDLAQVGGALEERYPEHAGKIRSAIELARTKHPLSPSLAERTIAAGRQSLLSVSESRLINFQILLHVFLFFLLALSPVFSILILQPRAWETWVERHVYGREAAWPNAPSLHIEADQGRLRAVEGESLSVRILSKGPEPRDLSLFWQKDEGGQSGQARISRLSANRYESRVTRPIDSMQLQARSRRAVSQWVVVDVLERPDLSSSTLRVQPPPYTELPGREIAAEIHTLDLLPGSSVTLKGRASQALERAALFVDEKQVARADVAGARDFELQRVFSSEDAGQWTLEMQNREGIVSRGIPIFTARLLRDDAPEAAIAARDVRPIVTPDAVFSVDYSASDDLGLDALWLETRRIVPGEDTPQWKPMEAGRIRAQTPLARLTNSILLDLSTRELNPGDRLEIRATAADRNDITGPGIGYSETLSFEIVSPSQLASLLAQDESALRFEIENRRRRETERREAIPDVGGEREALQEVTLRAADAVGDLAARADALAREIRANRLEPERGPLQRRLSEEVAAPLNAAARVELPLVARAIAGGQSASALEGQQRVLEQIDRALAGLQVAADRLAAIRILSNIRQIQDALRRETGEAVDEQIEDIFED